MDPLTFILDLDVAIAWAQTMPWQVLWLPTERVLVLNAQESRVVLAVEALRLMMPDRVLPLQRA